MTGHDLGRQQKFIVTPEERFCIHQSVFRYWWGFESFQCFRTPRRTQSDILSLFNLLKLLLNAL